MRSLRAPQGYPRKTEVAAPPCQEDYWSGVDEVQPPQPLHGAQPELWDGVSLQGKVNFVLPFKSSKATKRGGVNIHCT